MARITARQVDATRSVVRWYLARYWGTSRDLGGPATFTDASLVGKFAVSRGQWERGEPRALFRVLIAMTLFQRRQDQQVFRILRGMRAQDVKQLATTRALEAALSEARCRLLRSSIMLHERCDLTKVPGKTLGTCHFAPQTECHLKRHTVLLKRYGHFGKVPTSALLMLRGAGVRDLSALRRRALAQAADPMERARWLERTLMGVWRISRKISAMFLSALCNPDLGGPAAPWSAGVDWTRFVVIDSNTDLFLASIGYRGAGTYDARLDFICDLSRRIDLAQLNPALQSVNPRVVQQAMYMFMSASNRRHSRVDCLREPRACDACPRVLRARCPVASLAVSMD